MTPGRAGLTGSHHDTRRDPSAYRAGTPYTATYNATTAEILPSLGRNLSGGTRTAAVPLVMPQTLREARRTQVDLRVTKYLTLAPSRRVQLNFDIYNLLNAADVLGENVTFGGVAA